MRIAVNFALDVPDEAVADLIELAGGGARLDARRFVQAEAEQYTIDYLQDNGVTVRPIRGVALAPEDYEPGSPGQEGERS